jgi:hypothetical protein
MQLRPDLVISLSLSPRQVGFLLAFTTSLREMAQEGLVPDRPLSLELAKSSMDFVRRVRRQVETVTGAVFAAQLEEEVQEMYGAALEENGAGPDPGPWSLP